MGSLIWKDNSIFQWWLCSWNHCYFSQLHSNLDFIYLISLAALCPEIIVIRCISCKLQDTWLTELTQAHSHTYIIEIPKETFSWILHSHSLYTEDGIIFLLILEVPSIRSWEINSEMKNIFVSVAHTIAHQLEWEIKAFMSQEKEKEFWSTMNQGNYLSVGRALRLENVQDRLSALSAFQEQSENQRTLWWLSSPTWTKGVSTCEHFLWRNMLPSSSWALTE